MARTDLLCFSQTSLLRMQSYNARAINIDCLRCKFLPSVLVLPCNHILCYEHYLCKNWKTEKIHCAQCGKEVRGFAGLKQEDPVTPVAHPCDRTWSINTPADSSDQWPSFAAMNNHSNTYGNGLNGQYYQSPRSQFTPLQTTSSQQHRHQQYQGFPPPSSYQYHQSHQQQRSITSVTPIAEAQFGGNSGLNPSTQRFEPRSRYQDPIVRPESSISNASFATQLPRAPYTPFAPAQQVTPSSRPPYLGQSQSGWTQPYGGGSYNTMHGLSAGVTSMTLNSGINSRQLATVDEGSETTNSRRGSAAASLNSGASTPRSLAESIKNGETEDPYDRSLKRLDTPTKNPAPTLGPARFKDSKMFSTAAEDSPDIDFAGSSTPQRSQGPPSTPGWLDLAVQSLYTPTIGEAFDSLPFTELCRNTFSSRGGVIRVKDIPYQTTRQEMTAFVGRNAQILRQPEGSPYHAVHVTMERETGKTMDCFIELTTPNEAAWVVRQFANRVNSKRPAKVADRPVEVVYSSQDELLQELFPRAKHVRWSSGHPVVDTTPRQYYSNQFAAGFQGFIHSEELVMLQKHANLSDRSPFASKSPCRVYESMITTLYKYPWYAVDWVTIKERRAIFDCCMGLFRTLIEQLRRGNYREDPLDPSPGLLQELVIAALTCPGFSEKQKAAIVSRLHQSGYSTMVEGRFVSVALGGCHEFSTSWPFAALSYLPGTGDHLIKYFAKLFREATTTTQSLSLAARKAAEAAGSLADPMGQFTIDYGAEPGNLSLAHVAKIEYNKVEELLKIVCRHEAGPASSSAPASTARGRGDNSQGSYSSDGVRSAF